MNELQKIEFDMLKEVVRVCSELKLTYYLVCGSALGAIKYCGFIPWDDDMDIALPRRDYEIFIKEAQALLPENLFLQNYHTEPSFPQIFSKLRNSETTYIEKSVSKLPVNHGVYIDIFPLDEYPSDRAEQKKLERKKTKQYLKLSVAYCSKKTGRAALFGFFGKLFHYDRKIRVNVEKLEDALTRYKGPRSDILCNHGNWQGNLEYAPREQYGNGKIATFEGLSVRVPEKYDEYLTQKYGDWRAELPHEQQVGHHYAEVIDLTRPYTDYIEKLTDGKIRIKRNKEIRKKL